MKVETIDLTSNQVVTFDKLEGTIDRLYCDNIENIKNIIFLTDQMYFIFYTNDTVCRDQKIIFSFFNDLYLPRIAKTNLRVQFTLISKIETKIYIAYRPDKSYPFLDIWGSFYALSNNLTTMQKKMIVAIVSKEALLVISEGNVIEGIYDGYYRYDVKSDYIVYGKAEYSVIRKIKFLLSGGVMTIM